MSHTRILIVPGRGNSEPEHWQSIAESAFPDTQRVQQENWNAPSLDEWSRNIDSAVRALGHRPLVVAHSFGCLATAYAQITLGTPVGAVLFVAPADPERFNIPRETFAETLEQPGILIASNNDPWLSLGSARLLAADWGIKLFNLGAAGHINVASGYGHWPLVETIIKLIRDDLDREGTTDMCAPHRRTPVRQECRVH